MAQFLGYSVTKMKGNPLFPAYTIAKSRKRFIADLKRKRARDKNRTALGLENGMRRNSRR